MIKYKRATVNLLVALSSSWLYLLLLVVECEDATTQD